jgi:hypothetical protein
MIIVVQRLYQTRRTEASEDRADSLLITNFPLDTLHSAVDFLVSMQPAKSDDVIV